ncbi:MAG: helix-turn-helix domain-containing protein [Saprospiraceae bacterium]
MKARLEKIQPDFGASFVMKEFSNGVVLNKPNWHIHPEYEIVYISNGKGKRHIGDHISFYEDGDLIFLGPNLPHYGFTEDLVENHVEIVVQMREDFFGNDFLSYPEMENIQFLFQLAHRGISFKNEIKHEVGRQLKEMLNMSPFERLLGLLRVLEMMATTTAFQILNATKVGFEVNPRDVNRLAAVFRHVESNFKEEISLNQAADLINMTVPAFCRYFKKTTNKTFTQFLNNYRISYACKLLSNEEISISEVSFESGFNNLSHFNKQFRKIVNCSPKEYRNNQLKILL